MLSCRRRHDRAPNPAARSPCPASSRIAAEALPLAAFPRAPGCPEMRPVNGPGVPDHADRVLRGAGVAFEPRPRALTASAGSTYSRRPRPPIASMFSTTAVDARHAVRATHRRGRGSLPPPLRCIGAPKAAWGGSAGEAQARDHVHRALHPRCPDSPVRLRPVLAAASRQERDAESFAHRRVVVAQGAPPRARSANSTSGAAPPKGAVALADRAGPLA